MTACPTISTRTRPTTSFAGTSRSSRVGPTAPWRNFAAPDIVDHVSGEHGHTFWHVLAGWVRDSFAEYRIDVHAVTHEGDRVTCWFTAHGRHVGNGFPQLAGVPVRGRDIAWDQAHIFRVRDGLVVEHWAVRDDRALTFRRLEADRVPVRTGSEPRVGRDLRIGLPWPSGKRGAAMEGMSSWSGARIDWRVPRGADGVVDLDFEGRIDRAEVIGAGLVRIAGEPPTGGRFVLVTDEASIASQH